MVVAHRACSSAGSVAAGASEVGSGGTGLRLCSRWSRCQHGMTQEHLGTGIPHHFADFIPHGGPVAVNRAIGTHGLVFTPRAFAKSGLGIFEQRRCTQDTIPRASDDGPRQ